MFPRCFETPVSGNGHRVIAYLNIIIIVFNHNMLSVPEINSHKFNT